MRNILKKNPTNNRRSLAIVKGRVIDLLNEGVDKKRYGDYAGAKENYYQAIILDPTYYMSFYSLAKTYYLTREYQASALNYLRATHLGIRASIMKNAAQSKKNKMMMEYILTTKFSTDTLRNIKKEHQYVHYLLWQWTLLSHLGHSLFDFIPDSFPLLPDEIQQNMMLSLWVQKNIGLYQRELSGERVPRDDQLMEEAVNKELYYPWSIKFLINTICWEQIDSADVTYIYSNNYTKINQFFSAVRA